MNGNSSTKRSVTYAGALLGVSMAVVLSACSTGSNSAAKSSTAGKSSSSKISVAYVLGTTDAYFGSVACGVKAEAQKLGISNVYTVGASTYSPSAQIPEINAAAARHPSVLIVSPTDSTAVEPALQRAKAAGSVIVSNATALTDPSLAQVTVVANDHQAGTTAADILNTKLHGKGLILPLLVVTGNQADDNRLNAFESEMKKLSPGYTFLSTQVYNNSIQTASSIVTSTLAAHPGLAGIYATNTTGTEGSATALRDLNKVGKVQIVGQDAEPQEVQDVTQGVVLGIMAAPGYMSGMAAVQYGVDSAEGKSTPSTVTQNFQPITAKTIPGIQTATVNSPQAISATYNANCSATTSG